MAPGQRRERPGSRNMSAAGTYLESPFPASPFTEEETDPEKQRYLHKVTQQADVRTLNTGLRL